MSELNGGRAKAWNIYSSSSSSSSSNVSAEVSPWKSFGTSMDAISFGFVATAILISMFLIMAIFEHLFRPNVSSQDDSSGMESRQLQKLGNPDGVQTSSYASDFSVVMPGQQYPTFIAQPAPLQLPSCHREGVIYWPSQSHVV